MTATDKKNYFIDGACVADELRDVAQDDAADEHHVLLVNLEKKTFYSFD